MTTFSKKGETIHHDVYSWPPPTISKWLKRRTVSTSHLAVELRAWAEWAERNS